MKTSTHFSKEYTDAPLGGQVFCHNLPLLRRLGKPSISGLYLHIPFCFHKCHYCDFYSIVDERDRQTAFAERLIEEARAAGPLVRGAIRTIFVGGGTPTLMRPDLWRRLLPALREAFNLSELAEFTVEANPETVTEDLLEVLAAGGVNRISIGAQSFNSRHLKTLERWHDPTNVGKALRLARSAGIDNASIDLIFAIPGQSMEDWLSDLDEALSLQPSHLSCYSLMYEPNTAMTKRLEMGRIDPCDESLEAAMYEATIDTLTAAGFEHYEVSNFAKPARRCEHNLLYWRNENWLALGPSASGHINGVRWKNAPHLGRYLASTFQGSGDSGDLGDAFEEMPGGGDGGVPIQDVEQLDPDASFGEQLMLRLRLLEGVELDWLEPRLIVLDSRENTARRRAIEDQIAAGLLERTPTHLRLTRRGLMLADSVIAELL